MTRRLSGYFIFALAGLLALRGSLRADATNPAPDFKEVYELLRANLPGATDGTLNRAAVEGLLSQFPGKVSLVADTADGAAAPAGGTALGKSAVLENNVAYLRVNRVTGSLAGELGAAGRALTATNKVVGAILDLRFAGGDDYTAAQEIAGLWTTKKASRPIPGPLVVLVNGGTSGTAEALVTALRTAGAALVLGSPTAGAAMIFKAFVLKDGERLLIAAPLVKTDDKTIPAGGLKPDIAVAVNADDERVYWKNPYGLPAPGGSYSKTTTNAYLPYIDHTSEADLVRERKKDGKLINPSGPARRSTPRDSDDNDGDEDATLSAASRPQKPVLRDPVLARAVDLVKGLAVVREARP